MSEYPKTMYRASFYWRPELEAVQVDRETESSVFVRGNRRARASNTDNYFDSFEEAKAFLLAKGEEAVEGARASLQRAHDNLGNVKGMKTPELLK